MRAPIPALVLCLAAACQGPAPRNMVLGPLGSEAELYVYAAPGAAVDWPFTPGAVSVIRADGSELPLETIAGVPPVADAAPRQRLVAFGRVPPGQYQGLLVAVPVSGGHPSAAAPGGPRRVELALALRPGSAAVVQLSAQASASGERAMAATVAFPPPPDAAAYCADRATGGVTVLDRRSRQALAVIPAGVEPEGISVDARRARAYVALGGEDAVAILDLGSAEPARRLPLRGGDRPRDVALTPDGNLLLVASAGSSSVVFVDPAGPQELARVAVGEEPWSLLVDRAGRRAWVVSRRAATVTALDLGTRAVAATASTEAEPVAAQLDRAAARLYVIHAGSAYLSILGAVDLAPVRRLHVGFGASAVRVDPRTDLIYLASRLEPRIQVIDPLALVPVASIELPGPASRLALDEQANALLALLPGSRAVAFIDLTSRRVTGLAEVGRDPSALAVLGERN